MMMTIMIKNEAQIMRVLRFAGKTLKLDSIYMLNERNILDIVYATMDLN